MSDYLHNLIQCLAIAHCVTAAVLAFATFMAWAEDVPVAKRLTLVTFLLGALIPITAAWLATYGGIR
jgi:hypothetical protein